MKRFLSVAHPPLAIDFALLLSRVGIAAMMLVHGWPKLTMLTSGATQEFPDVLGLGSTVALALTVFAEVVCSLAILLGFGTRIASIPLIITMLIAVFYI